MSVAAKSRFHSDTASVSNVPGFPVADDHADVTVGEISDEY
jgi:hypothetical protein